jgi:hypothetical protein
MFSCFLTECAVLDRVAAAEAVGTADVTSDIVDMAGFDAVVFVVLFGAITDGTPKVKVQSGAAAAMGDAADLEGTSVAVAITDDNKLAVADVTNVSERYVRCVVTRGGNTGAVVDGILAIKYKAKKCPVTQSADVAGIERHVTPAEGTA